MVEFGSRNVFPTDPADVWGNVHRVGNAELAVRLGSINTFDRRGDVIWLDGFESAVLKWNAETIVSGGSASLSADYSRTEEQVVKLVTAATTDSGHKITMYKPVMMSGRVGFEFSFSTGDDTWQLTALCNILNGTNMLVVGFRWIQSTDTLRILGTIDALTYVDVMTDAIISHTETLFNTIKIVADVTTGKYVKLLWNDVVIDLSDYSIYSYEV